MAKEQQVDPQKRFAPPLLMARNPTNETTTMMVTVVMMVIAVMIVVMIAVVAVDVTDIDEKNL